MKHFKQHWSAQPLSVLMSLLMALPVLALFLLGSPRAQAQDLARTLPTWAVLDFANPSGYGSTDVGRLAADSFVVELAKLNRYSVLPRQDLLNAITSNSLTPPLNLTSIEKVGQSLGASAIVAGEISSVSFSQDRRQAKVSIVVRVIDPRSGYLLNGALAEGSSNVRPIPVSDEESLVNEAFANAAFNAVKQISKFNLPVATVLIGRGINSVTLNKGSRDGLYNGLDMLVTRNGVVTGTIKVSEVSNNDANAVVTDQGQGIRPEDRATAIYTLPSYSIDKSVGSFRTASSGDVSSDSPTHKSKSNFFSGVGGILVALLAGALIVSAVRAGHSEKSLGGAAVQGPHAVAGRATLIGGTQTSISSTLPTGLTTLGSLYIPVAVRITSDVGNINPNNFLEYHVYRSDAPAALSSPASLGIIPTQGTNSNTGNNNNTNTGNNNNTGGNVSTFSFGQIPLFAQAGHGNLTAYDSPFGITSITASKPDITDNSQLLTITATTAVTAATTTTTTGTVSLITGQPIPGTGLNLGQRVFYTVEGLYIQPATFSTGTLNPGTNTNGNTNNNTNTNTGNNTGVNNTTNNNNTGTNNNNNNTGTNNTGTTTGHDQTYQLTGLRSTNYVTLIEPVTPSAGAATGTGLNNVNFTIPATRGGTDYVLEIATDPGFANAQRFAPQPGSYNAPITNPTNLGITISAAAGNAVIFNNINLTTAFPNASQFFYRVGARDLLNGSSESDNPYIFNDPLPVNLNAGATALSNALLSGNARTRQQNQHRSRF